MDNKNKDSILYKVQKNPFIIVLFLIVLVVMVVCIASLSKAMKAKTEELATTTAPVTTEQSLPEVTVPDYTVQLSNVKNYAENVEKVSAHYENTCAVLTVQFKDKESLLAAHIAENEFSIKMTPYFVFYISNGVQVRCPATIRLAQDGATVNYILSEINDLKNAVALTDSLTVDYSNVLSDIRFNLYLELNEGEDIGRTVVSTYGLSYEEFLEKYGSEPVEVSEKADGVKKVDLVSTEKFVWLDIYFENEEAYKQLNHNFVNNFLCFGFEHGGKKFERKFIVTQYDDLCMLRCKFDSYSLRELIDETGENLSIPDIFDSYMSVWTTDYETEQALFAIN